MNPITRRQFLERTGVSTIAAALSGCSTSRLPTALRPCPPTAWQKHGIVLEPTEPWERDGIQNFTSPAEPLSNGKWRLWYSVAGSRHGGIAYAEGIPGESMRKIPAVCAPGEPPDAPFAIGHLPADWQPTQVVHIRQADGRHRIYFWAHGPQIVRYLAADSDDGQRYRVVNPLRPVLYHPHDRAVHGVPSPDGVLLHKQPSRQRPADEPLAPSQLISNDATMIYRLPDGHFEMFSVALVPVPPEDPAYIAHDNAPGLIRVIDRYTSEDGLHFTTRQRVIQRDAADPADQQFYHLAVTRTRRGSVGMLGHYRCAAQTMDLEWCWSADGVRWERPQRQAWLPRSEPPAPDCYGIYPGSSLVERAGRWYLFYTGVNSAHNGRHSYGPPRDVIMLATTASIWA